MLKKCEQTADGYNASASIDVFDIINIIIQYSYKNLSWVRSTEVTYSSEKPLIFIPLGGFQ